MYSPDLFEICDGNHIMLVCEDDTAKLDAATHFINEGLGSDQLCIYASVHAFDPGSDVNVANLKSRIINYESYLKKGKLKFVDFKPFYNSAVMSNLEPFELLKEKFETMLHTNTLDGKQEKIMLFADAACCLTENKQFEETRELETWWQRAHYEWLNKDLKITVICPHPAQMLRQELEVKWNIADAHDIMVFLQSHLLHNSRSGVSNSNNLRILVAESEPDILTLYSDYLSAMGHDVSVTTDYNRCLSLFKKRDFNLVILDTHIVGNSTIGEITKEMMRIEPHQRILLTSTYSSSQITGIIDNPKLDKFQLLQKPFHLSRLLNAIELSLIHI